LLLIYYLASLRVGDRKIPVISIPLKAESGNGFVLSRSSFGGRIPSRLVTIHKELLLTIVVSILIKEIYLVVGYGTPFKFCPTAVYG